MLATFNSYAGRFEMVIHDECRRVYDLGTSTSILVLDEYSLMPFVNHPSAGSVRKVLDIGANIGAFSLLTHALFPEAQIMAVEPEPSNLELLNLNLESLGGLGTIIPKAIAPVTGTVQLAVHPRNSGASYVVDQVPDQPYAPINSVAVDAISVLSAHQIYDWSNVDLLKVDTEGSEEVIFQDLSELGLLNDVKWIRFEWHGQERAKRIEQILTHTHHVLLHPSNTWNGLGIAHHRKLV